MKWPVDGLFPWLAIQGTGWHINIMHAGGIWTSRHSELVVMTNATIVLMLGCFLVTQPIVCGQPVKEDNDIYIKPFADPRSVVDRYI